MHIRISLEDGVPIYRQIVNQVKYLVASRQLVAGDEIPPIRTLAEQLRVTPNTVVRAYRELEMEGIVRKRRGAGTYIAESSPSLTRKEQRRILAERADALLTEARLPRCVHQLSESMSRIEPDPDPDEFLLRTLRLATRPGKPVLFLRRRVNLRGFASVLGPLPSSRPPMTPLTDLRAEASNGVDSVRPGRVMARSLPTGVVGSS